jgi:hypothetical protein
LRPHESQFEQQYEQDKADNQPLHIQ